MHYKCAWNHPFNNLKHKHIRNEIMTEKLIEKEILRKKDMPYILGVSKA